MGLSSKDLLDPKKAPLVYQSYGFKNPNNNLGAMSNRLAFPLYDRTLSSALFANEIEPDRQGAIRALIANNNPANAVANANAKGSSIYNQAQSQGTRGAQLLAQRGGGMGAQLGAIAQSQNQGTDLMNQLLLHAYSPEGQNHGLMAILNAANQAMGTSEQDLLALQGPITQKEHDRMAREASKGMALQSLLGMAGGMAGGFDWGQLFGGGKLSMNPYEPGYAPGTYPGVY